MILYDLQNGGGGSDDDQDLGGDDDNGSAAIMTGKGVVNYGDITYGDLYDKIVAYTQSPKYQAQKKSQKQLTVIQNETVTTENWNDAQKYLTEMGFSTQQLSELKALWTRYKHQAWTYGELLQQYNSGNRGIE
ncbi:MAG: hypothetical protein JNL72_14985 [Flavipsychrobacter sp.]|nr:hypothetical protein [Flavipsychrobacter sp.]